LRAWGELLKCLFQTSNLIMHFRLIVEREYMNSDKILMYEKRYPKNELKTEKKTQLRGIK